MRKVLIADDNENNRAVLHDALEDEGYELLEAIDGTDAIKQINERQPDLVLLDLMMPGVDGLVVLKTIMSSAETQHIKTIMLTAINSDAQTAECLNEGAVDYICKPFSNMVIRARVRAALRFEDKSPASSLTSQSSSSKPANTTRGKVVAFIGARGGSGVTTLATNAAVHHAENDAQVNLWEIRFGLPTAPMLLGTNPQASLQSLLESDSTEIDESALGEVLENHLTGLQVLSGKLSLDEIEQLTPERAVAIVQSLTRMAEITVLDLPDKLCAMTRPLLEEADYVVLVVEADPVSFHLANETWAVLKSWGIGRQSIGAVINHRAPCAVPIKLEEVKESLSCDVVGVIPPSPDTCLTSLRASVPFVLYRPNEMISETVSALSDRLVFGRAPTLVC